MAQSDRPPQEPASTAENVNNPSSLWRRLFGRDSTASGMPDSPPKEQGSQSDDDPKRGLIRRVSRKVVPGLPRAQTFKRQQSEIRNKLEPVQPTPAERRAVSVDRRLQTPQTGSHTQSNPRSSAPDFTNQSLSGMPSVPSVPSFPVNSLEEKMVAGTANPEPPIDGPNFHDGLYDGDGHNYFPDGISTADCHSMTTSQYDALIHEELERTWILNLSMHFRDKSKREKFFVTYRERPTLWRRVTISIDYRNAPDNSLELELSHIKFQRDKIAKIYDAIRESLVDIQFYSTVTNLKLQTTDGRLHVHVVEDVNEIIHYPSVRTIQHMRCNRVKERDIEFDSHISGFVYKVRVNDEVLIKKEIPGPDTVDEFLYEINALNRLKHSNHVIRFYGVIVDDNEEHVKGLLISHAEQGALIDIIYDQIHPLPWRTRERWARQIVAGLSDIHEAGFVQGDFTLSNIVVDDDDNAKIIDINRRGCPVGWEPPEATPLIESNQRISMYIGVKSDLYQLGMVLWALAMKEDEPEAHGRPLHIGSDVQDVPNWFRRVVDICLSEDPRGRMSALQLLSIFPDPEPESDVGGWYDHPSISVDDGVTRKEYFLDADPTANGYPRVRTAQPTSDWSYVGWGHSYVGSPNGLNDEPFFYPVTRGRSPPSPLPSNPGEYDSSRYGYRTAAWMSTPGSARTAPSECDADAEEKMEEGKKSVTPRRSQRSVSDTGEITGVDHSRVPEPAEDRPPQLDSKTAADVPDVDGQLTNMLDPGELRVPSRPQTPQQQQQTAGPSMPDKVPELSPREVSKGSEVCEVRSCVESACVQQMQGEGDDPPETGHTEPTLPEEIGGASPTLEARDLGSGPDGTNTQASATAAMSLDQPWGELEIAPETVKLPDSGPPSERTQDGVQAATLPDESEKTFQKATITADNTQTDQSHEMSQSTPQNNEPCGIPDELKGVGSTYETGPENLHQSMTGHDIAILIDAEMAAGAKE